MNEFELISRLIPLLPTNDSVVAGAGDDCAVVQSPGTDQYLLLKTDAVVEGVHFTADTDPKKVGHKALARCLSDIAAMAGTPQHALVTLALPPIADLAYLEAIYAGMGALAKRYQVAIVGGETVRNPERLVLSVAVVGTVAKCRCILRSGSQPGDALFVSGQLGGSLAGRHLDFEPRLREAQWLVAHFSIHAMIDLSDGLAGDIQHLLRPGNLGADLLTTAIPISRAARAACKANPSDRTPLVAALSDGEDFELLFTVTKADAVPLLDGWKQRFPETPLSCIGRVTATPGVRLRTKTGFRPMTEHGYVHFEERG